MGEAMAKRKTKHSGDKSKTLFIIIGCILFFMLLISLPMFSIQDITIIGNEQITDAQIRSETGIEVGKNIFYINKSKARKKLLANAYVNDVKITTKFPHSITIELEERKIRGYIRHESLGNFLLIDINGRVLDVKTVMPLRLPVILGLKFSGFTIGEILDVSNEIEFEIVVELSRLLEKHNILDIVNVDVTDKSDIRLYINDAEFKFGQFENAYEKVALIKSILENWPEGSVGTVDVSDISRNTVFEYLT